MSKTRGKLVSGETVTLVNPQAQYPAYGEFAFTHNIIDSSQWAAINTGLTNTNVEALVIDPTDANTLYAGTEGGGVFVITQVGNFRQFMPVILKNAPVN